MVDTRLLYDVCWLEATYNRASGYERVRIQRYVCWLEATYNPGHASLSVHMSKVPGINTAMPSSVRACTRDHDVKKGAAVCEPHGRCGGNNNDDDDGKRTCDHPPNPPPAATAVRRHNATQTHIRSHPHTLTHTTTRRSVNQV